MKRIDGHARTVSELLKSKKYAVDDSYQREYKWQTKQVLELLDDLTGKFVEDYDEDDPREAVEVYGHYFLGSIVVSQKAGRNFVVDGQQRLTTLTLLLIYLHNQQGDRPDRVNVEELIFSERFGKKSFNIDVDERTPCMEALFNQQEFDETGKSESVRSIVGRYDDIEKHFTLAKDVDEEGNGRSQASVEFTKRALPYFVDWLTENVHLVEITAYADDDAYTIFETMNDRGLSLVPLEMLKGYVLANITDDKKRQLVNTTWKTHVTALTELGKDEDADAFKAWLRSQYAKTIRERKRGASPGDFDRLVL